MSIEIIEKYFELNDQQKQQFVQFSELVLAKNQVVNLISRKDEANIWIHHILHSVSMASRLALPKGSRVLDVGTGGGFPGIPMAILFPDSHFTLIDSIQKKINAVSEFSESLKLNNVDAQQIRAEKLKGNFDFVISRAVTKLDAFTIWVWKNIKPGKILGIEKGIYYLRGPDFDPSTINSEIHRAFEFGWHQKLSALFDESFFETKSLVFLRRK